MWSSVEAAWASPVVLEMGLIVEAAHSVLGPVRSAMFMEAQSQLMHWQMQGELGGIFHYLWNNQRHVWRATQSTTRVAGMQNAEQESQSSSVGETGGIPNTSVPVLCYPASFIQMEGLSSLNAFEEEENK